MICSPTESAVFREALGGGGGTWKCEAWGCDAIWSARGVYYGVQRKALKDLVASVEDGRLATERLQWPSVTGGVWVIVETGERGGAGPREMPNGTLASLGTYGRAWTGAQVRGLMYSLGMDDAVNGIVWVENERDTIARVIELRAWTMKDRHASARGPGKIRQDVFGNRGSKEYATYLLQCLPGIGPTTAVAIYDHFQGLPLQWTSTYDELIQVPGVGPLTAKRLMSVFDAA